MPVFVLFKLCAITTMIACLVDMLVTRSIQNSNFLAGFSSEFRENAWSRHMFWRWFGLIAGKRTMDFMSSRALFFPVAELIFPLALTASLAAYGWSLLVLPNLVFAVFVMLIAVVNLRTHYVPHAVSRPGILLGIALGLVQGWQGLLNAVLGAWVAFGIFIVLYYLSIPLGRLRSRRLGVDDEPALGAGVVYAATLTGAYCGFPHVLGALGFAIMAGGLISMLFIFRRMWVRRSVESMLLSDYMDYGDIIVIGGAVYKFLVPLFS